MSVAIHDKQLTSFRGVDFSSVQGAGASTPFFSTAAASLGTDGDDGKGDGRGGTIGGTVFTCAGLRPPLLAALIVLAELLEPLLPWALPELSAGRC